MTDFYDVSLHDALPISKECIGADEVSKLLIYVHQTFNSALETKCTIINHQPAVLFMQDGMIQSCQIFDIRQGNIIRVDAVIEDRKSTRLNSSHVKISYA